MIGRVARMASLKLNWWKHGPDMGSSSIEHTSSFVFRTSPSVAVMNRCLATVGFLSNSGVANASDFTPSDLYAAPGSEFK